MTEIKNILEKISRTLFDIQLIEKEKVSLMRKYTESVNKELEYRTPPEDWTCPRCHKKGFPSIWGIVCTSCANELRTPEYVEQAIEDGWLNSQARNNVIRL